MIPPNHASHTITGADVNEINEMKMEKQWNEICGREKERNSENTYPDPVSFTMKLALRDRGANSRP